MKIEKRIELLEKLNIIQDAIIYTLQRKIKNREDWNNPEVKEAILRDYSDELNTLEQEEKRIREELKDFPGVD